MRVRRVGCGSGAAGAVVAVFLGVGLSPGTASDSAERGIWNLRTERRGGITLRDPCFQAGRGRLR